MNQPGLPCKPRSPAADLFMKIPNEILRSICLHLRGRGLRAFLTASGAAYHATINPAFWKILGSRRAPWAWEFWREMPNKLRARGRELTTRGSICV